MRKIWIFIFACVISGCSNAESRILTGAEQIPNYLPLLEGKTIGIVSNHTSLVGTTHLVDTLKALSDNNFEIKCIFSPEHGFRGKADAGASIVDGIDKLTGLPVISLYGNNRKPTKEQMEGIDLVVFDLQDIGVRFYTYISTMHYAMEVCAEQGIPFLVLDRPNPNGNYVDGPVLDTAFRSFVGMHPIPVVHGLTIGELAHMINGEGWLGNGTKKEALLCDLTVIPCKNYTHSMEYILPVKPSPNLPNHHSIRMYPSTCFFEGTVLSEGRGTLNPFEIYGHPELEGSYSFTPRAIEGMSMHPKFKDELCYGENLEEFEPVEGWTQLELGWLIQAYESFVNKQDFFISYFNTLSGTSALQDKIVNGWTAEAIRESWKIDLQSYKKMRSKYLLYD